MIRALAILVFLAGSGATLAPQDPPAAKKQILLKNTMYSAKADLWADVREVDREFKAIGAEVAKRAKGLEAEAIEDRNKASGALRALGLAAFGAIKEARDKAASETVRWELDAILKDLAGNWPATLSSVPYGRPLGKAEGEALRKRLAEQKIRIFQQPFMSLRDGAPAAIFVGEEVPAGAGGRRIRIDAEGKKLKLEETRPASTLKFGFEMLIKPAVTGKDGKSISLEIAITSTHIRRPIREIETPLGRELDPEVVKIGIDLSPVLQDGQAYIAGPFPAADSKEDPWWILLEAQVVKP